MRQLSGMFIEVNSASRKSGWIEVVCGSMFSGKTEELIRRVNRALIANQRVVIFKPSIDTRYHETMVVSHDKKSIRSIPVTSSQQIPLLVEKAEVIGIDEVQFFDEGIVDVARELANNGSRVIAAGLDMDFLGRPFGPMPALLATAEFVTKVHAICQKCGSLANYSYRKTAQTGTVLLGEKDTYEPRCRTCFLEGD